MRAFGLLCRGSVGLVLVVGLLAAAASPGGAASKYARITIHKAVCPHDETSDIFDNCHANKLGGVGFAVVNPSGHATARATSKSGVASFSPRAGRNVVAENPAVLDQYVGAYVFCKDQVSGHVFFDGLLPHPHNAVVLHTSGGQQIICDWYNLT
jgi:hypothetical protein